MIKICIAVGYIGLVLLIIGCAQLQSTANSSLSSMGITLSSFTGNNAFIMALGIYWYLFFYSLALYVGISFALIKNSVKKNKVAIVGFCAAFLGTVPVPISVVFVASEALLSSNYVTIMSSHTPEIYHGARIIAAGCILTIMPIFVLILLIGTESNSLVAKMAGVSFQYGNDGPPYPTSSRRV